VAAHETSTFDGYCPPHASGYASLTRPTKLFVKNASACPIAIGPPETALV